jgi:hypothetical protein
LKYFHPLRFLVDCAGPTALSGTATRRCLSKAASSGRTPNFLRGRVKSKNNNMKDLTPLTWKYLLTTFLVNPIGPFSESILLA